MEVPLSGKSLPNICWFEVFFGLMHVSSSRNFAAIREVVLAVVLRLNSLFSTEEAIFTTLSIVQNIQKMDVFVG